jgi:hypothetical protein
MSYATEPSDFHCQVAACKRIETAWRKIEDLHRLAADKYGTSLDVGSTDDRIAVGDERRALYKQLSDTTDEFQAACKTLDKANKDSDPHTNQPVPPEGPEARRGVLRATRTDDVNCEQKARSASDSRWCSKQCESLQSRTKTT